MILVERLDLPVDDSAIVAGFVVLLIALYDQRQPSDVVDVQPTFAGRLGLGGQLERSRSNGLAAIVETIRTRAQDFIALSDNSC